jgi:hypothetical protein
MMCPKLRKLFECNCDFCRRQTAKSRGINSAKQEQTDQRLSQQLSSLYQQMAENRRKGEEIEKTRRLLILMNRNNQW